ncbi:hypothetical protein EK21DRAFT_112259 [Setomelanomma holmii]|uniref:Uncharacterized protein n=1 Tax=Setomelanomma holmii TaxID=210430 RepID=A0A9P4LMY0_9PLEO|nr:hypothetical protein EK21DRAFT_112259 [Setomelanomma holmii]
MIPSRGISRGIASGALPKTPLTASASRLSQSARCYSAKSEAEGVASTKDEVVKSTAKPSEETKPKKKTQVELDQELTMKMQGIAGDGGDAGVEYEDGKPVAMKRSVKNNMFRYI